MTRSIVLGVLLAWCDVFFIVAALLLTPAPRGLDVTINPLGELVLIFATFPALIAGAGIGWVAAACGDLPVGQRQALLVSIALMCVVLLGAASMLGALILPTSIPTIAFVLILERHTRTVPVLPPATAR